ncbi:hypothetical protein SLEP1_g55888 [Rubroshorea leprosula]|uniref:Secreted protein n=1 Tax=Rubroshorea leprosula TaxID=152421 RepID=A0AAV5MHY7_9ROSI|nr:hypothetical protein SLEP1_g55888 [Rubroshorea leprosula]
MARCITVTMFSMLTAAACYQKQSQRALLCTLHFAGNVIFKLSAEIISSQGSSKSNNQDGGENDRAEEGLQAGNGG